ncbi:FtsX-like permease family protein [Bifidobacterium sp. ESL0784]|uniref:ABC transporter permease n=1 Tax=Bifidobacterium sp. ESL0784 TaxID=2983231 RepID=UPI0023F6F1F2|nr:FtsX-like permease family protein [Bifidobacterium sp. ESL0784]MDF7641402.1 FtsX-like permease family protein [Bifidobacterium sp. ESL0784]
MFSVTLKLMKKSGKMLIPAGIAILIGTAFIAATFLFGNSMDDSLRTQLTSRFMQADYVVAPKGSNGGDSSAYSDDVPMVVSTFKADEIEKVDGVTATQPVVYGDGHVKKSDNSSTTMYGLGSTSNKLQPVEVVKGHSPLKADEAAVPEKMADKMHLKIGDTFKLTLSQGGSGNVPTADATLVGLTRDQNGSYTVYGGVTLVSPQVLTKLYGADSFSDVPSNGLLINVDPAKAGTAVPKVKQILGKKMSVDTRQHIGDEQMKSLSANGSSPVKIFLMVFGILAMFVAALVIANTFQVMIAQRRRTLALLRTIGAKKGQLYRSVLFEAGVLGLIASVLGILVAMALIGGLSKLGFVMGNMGSTMKLIVTWPVIVVPLAFGIIMTVLASIGSARSATAVTPLEALRPIEVTDTRKAGRVRGVLGALMIVFGVVCCALGASRMPSIINTPSPGDGSDTTYEFALFSAMGGCALLFIGLAITATFWLPVLMCGIGALVAHIGPSANIANANIQKNPRRVAATGVALLIGVTLVSTIATGAACGKQTMDSTLDSHYSVDMTAEGNGLTKHTADKVAKVKGVSDTLYLPTATANVKLGNGQGDNNMSVLLVGINNKQALQKVMHTDISSGSIAPGTVLAPLYNGQTGKKLNLANKTVEFTNVGKDGSKNHINLPETKVTQVDYRKLASMYSMVVFVDQSTLTESNVKTEGHILLTKFDMNAASVTDTFDAVQSALGSTDGINVSGPIADRVTWDTDIDQIMTLLVALLAVAVLIALIGVANTLSLSVIERTRESATLRAIGMTRGQLKRSLACEALLISLVSGVVGVVLGTAFGWLGSYMVFSLYGKTAYLFDWKFDGAVLLIAALAALISSIFPARRAVKTPPVAALAEA